MSMIKVKNLSKAYGKQKVLKNLDLDVESGETLVVLGRSGAGKSVTLRLIMGLDRPDEGSLEVDHLPVASAVFGQGGSELFLCRAQAPSGGVDVWRLLYEGSPEEVLLPLVVRSETIHAFKGTTGKRGCQSLYRPVDSSADGRGRGVGSGAVRHQSERARRRADGPPNQPCRGKPEARL